MPEVRLYGGLRAAADGAESVWGEGTTIRELLQNLGRKYPLLRERIDQGIAVSIDGVIYRDTWSKTLPKDAEIFLLPRISGG